MNIDFDEIEKHIIKILNPNLLENRGKHYWERAKEIREYLEEKIAEISDDK